MPEEPTATTDLFEIIRTTRSMRWLKPDPVPDELIRKILDAGVCAPTGGNMQRWRFLGDTGRQHQADRWGLPYARLGRTGRTALSSRRACTGHGPGSLPPAARGGGIFGRSHLWGLVWVVPCLQGDSPTRTSGSSIYPAVQNMLLAARALGLGATLTTLYLAFDEAVGSWRDFGFFPNSLSLRRYARSAQDDPADLL
jgi:nitroreductase